MNTWIRLNKGVRRLIMLGYAICLFMAVQTWRSIKPEREVQEEIAQRATQDIREHQERWSDPFFAESNNRYRKERIEMAGEEARKAWARDQDKTHRVWGLLIGYPLVVLLGLWVMAGFKSDRSTER